MLGMRNDGNGKINVGWAMIREAKPGEEIKPAEFIYRNNFMSMDHNYLCAVCREKPAVILCNHGVLQPCWDCMKNLKYVLVKTHSWFQRILLKIFFRDLA